MKNFEEKLYQILKESKFIKDEDLDNAYKSSQDMDRPLSDELIFKGLITEESLTQLIAEHLQVPFISLKNRIIADEILGLVPENLARNYRIIPFEKTDKGISLAMEDPENFEAQEIVKRRTGLPIMTYLVSTVDLNRALNLYKRDIKKKFATIVAENVKKAAVKDSLSLEGLIKIASELPIVKILDTLLQYAVAESASDLHFETLQNSLLIRLRIDGILHDIISLPKEIQPAIVARIKVLSNLKIDEHRIPQDGRFNFQIDNILIALRVSIIPAFFGENIVLRLLPESARPLSLEELGLAGTNLELVRQNIQKPNGMVLVTGPTGCGKTTTLYSLLNILNSPQVKICTVEDPIEYGIGRVNQTQVNPQTGLTFATGLRSLLRHDPNIIMVGEIRDNETANMAIHSSLTGHLVLSTLHTNDAPSTIPRFLDMGAEGYLIASTLNLAIAQRLVRRICTSCIEEIKPSNDLLRQLSHLFGGKPGNQKYYKGKGCEKCRSSGYKGRVGVFEVMEVNEEIRHLTLAKASSGDIRKAAQKNKMKTMFEDGLDKIGAGLTSIEEVLAAVME